MPGLLWLAAAFCRLGLPAYCWVVQEFLFLQFVLN